ADHDRDHEQVPERLNADHDGDRDEAEERQVDEQRMCAERAGGGAVEADHEQLAVEEGERADDESGEGRRDDHVLPGDAEQVAEEKLAEPRRRGLRQREEHPEPEQRRDHDPDGRVAADLRRAAGERDQQWWCGGRRAAGTPSSRTISAPYVSASTAGVSVSSGGPNATWRRLRHSTSSQRATCSTSCVAIRIPRPSAARSSSSSSSS